MRLFILILAILTLLIPARSQAAPSSLSETAAAGSAGKETFTVVAAAHVRRNANVNVNRHVNVNRNVHVNRNINVNRNVNINRRVNVGGPIIVRPVRPWARRPYYGAIIAGVTLGAIIAASAVPTPPSPDLCWYWANSSQTRGYWDYCQ